MDGILSQEIAEFTVIGVGRRTADDVTGVNVFQGMRKPKRLEFSFDLVSQKDAYILVNDIS